MANPYTNLMKPDAEVRLRETIGAISGTSIRRITALPPTNLNTMGLLDLRVKLEGWSPTLNTFTMKWGCSLRMDDDAATQGDKALRAFADQLAMQRQRLAQGMALGRASPFDISPTDGRAADTMVDHVLIDRGLAALLETAANVVREVGNSLYALHYEWHGDHDGLEETLQGDQDLEDHDGRPRRHSFHGRMLLLETVTSTTSTYDGCTLRVDESLPETVLAAMAGRRLGDVATVPSPLADHAVQKAWQHDGRIRIEVLPDLATVGDLRAETVARDGGV